MYIFRYIRWLLLSLVCVLSVSIHATELTIGVVPQFSVTEIYNSWNPVLNAITKVTNIHFRIKPYRNIPDFERGIMKSEVDIAYMNPYHLIMVQRSAGYIPIIRNGSSKLTGLLVVRKDSPYQSVKDLAGKTIAFPAPNAFGASLYMRALLSEQEKINFTAKYVKTHSNVWRQVLTSVVDAGGGIRASLNKESPEVKDNLRILYQTPGVNPHPIAVLPHVSESDRKAIQQAFMKLAQNPDTQRLLSNIQIPTPTITNFPIILL